MHQVLGCVGAWSWLNWGCIKGVKALRAWCLHQFGGEQLILGGSRVRNGEVVLGEEKGGAGSLVERTWVLEGDHRGGLR